MFKRTGEDIRNMKTRNKALILLAALSISYSAESQTIPKDKQLHLGAGAVIGAWGTLIDYDKPSWRSPVYGIGAATIAAAGKEIIMDKFMGWGNPEWKDFGNSVLGGAISVGLIEGAKYLVKKHRINKYSKNNSLDHEILSKKKNYSDYMLAFDETIYTPNPLYRKKEINESLVKLDVLPNSYSRKLELLPFSYLNNNSEKKLENILRKKYRIINNLTQEK
jgi:hypothetical protein